MTRYEVMFIVRPDIEGDDAVDRQIERYGRLIVDNGGEVTGVDKWGKRRFAYEINGFTEGYYVVIQFRSGHAVVDELNRIMRISDDIVRHIVVRLDEPKAAPAAAGESGAEGESADPTASGAAGEAQAAETAAP